MAGISEIEEETPKPKTEIKRTGGANLKLVVPQTKSDVPLKNIPGFMSVNDFKGLVQSSGAITLPYGWKWENVIFKYLPSDRMAIESKTKVDKLKSNSEGVTVLFLGETNNEKSARFNLEVKRGKTNTEFNDIPGYLDVRGIRKLLEVSSEAKIPAGTVWEALELKLKGESEVLDDKKRVDELAISVTLSLNCSINKNYTAVAEPTPSEKAKASSAAAASKVETKKVVETKKEDKPAEKAAAAKSSTRKDPSDDKTKVVPPEELSKLDTSKPEDMQKLLATVKDAFETKKKAELAEEARQKESDETMKRLQSLVQEMGGTVVTDEDRKKKKEENKKAKAATTSAPAKNATAKVETKEDKEAIQKAALDALEARREAIARQEESKKSVTPADNEKPLSKIADEVAKKMEAEMKKTLENQVALMERQAKEAAASVRAATEAAQAATKAATAVPPPQPVVPQVITAPAPPSPVVTGASVEQVEFMMGLMQQQQQMQKLMMDQLSALQKRHDDLQEHVYKNEVPNTKFSPPEMQITLQQAGLMVMAAIMFQILLAKIIA